MEERRYYRHRHGPSLFFPVLLVTVGVIWLMVNAGQITPENVLQLLPLWPVLLIVGGLSIILHRISWILGGLLWVATGALAIWLLLAGQAYLPNVPQPEFEQQTLREPLGEARSAAVTLDLSVNPVQIEALSGSSDLILADVYTSGEMRFETSGTTEKQVLLSESFSGINWDFNWIPALMQQMNTWEIGLSPRIPLDLTVDVGTGSTNLDLTGLQLNALNVEGGTGSMVINLPAEGETLPFVLDVSTGGVEVNVPDGASLEMTLLGSTGGVTIHLPEDAGVQVEVIDSSTGSLNLPSSYEKVSNGDDRGEGVWQNAAYTGADEPIRIKIDMSTGSVNIR